MIEIPFAAFRFLLGGEQHAVLPAHFPVKILHAQLLAPVRVMPELLEGAEEMSVGANLQGEAEGSGCGCERLPHPVFAGLGDDQPFGGQKAGGAGEFAGERLGVTRLIERGVVDGEPARPQRVAVVAHGGEENRDARLGRGDVFGVLGDLGHPDRIAGGIEAVERGGIGIELVAENQNEGAHTGMETGGAKFGEWGSGSRR